MSFIDDSEKNVGRLMKEQTAGSVAGHTGGKGMGIDKLFAGPFHPDSGFGSKNKELLLKQLKKRLEKRKDLKSDSDGVFDDFSGLADPIGGYFHDDVEDVTKAYEELQAKIEKDIEFNDKFTPALDTAWEAMEWDYSFDEIEIKDLVGFINKSTTNMEYVNVDIKYDDNSNLNAGDTYINKSKSNFQKVGR